jgi:hypothetical protein
MSSISSDIPPIRYYRSSQSGPKPTDRAALSVSVPLDRPGVAQSSTNRITYQEYLEAIGAVVTREWDRIKAAVSDQAPEESSHFQEIQIIAEKHGSDYHPARIRVVSGSGAVSLVANTALTERGRERMGPEYTTLRRLIDSFPDRFVPCVHFIVENTEASVEAGAVPVSMFFGEWLEAYHEFHITRGRKDGEQRVMLWYDQGGYRELAPDVGGEIYRQVARILTYYYDPDDFSEIFPWHHAAGDFTASTVGGKIDVKLITVRQYAPRAVLTEGESVDRMEALMLFFANLTLRNRLDRIDGIGDMAWVDDYCISATLEGFLSGLRLKTESGLCQADLVNDFRRAASSLSPVDLTRLFASVVDSYDPRSPDAAIISENLVDHILGVFKSIQDL